MSGATRGRVWVVIGARGEGKSVWAAHMARRTRPAIYVDPTRDAPLRGAPVVTLGTPGDRVAAALRRGMVLHLHCSSASAVLATQAALQVAIRERCSVWIDEAHLVHGRGRELPELTEAITAARHHRIDVGLITQAPQALSSQPLHAGCTVVMFRIPFSGPWLHAYGLDAGAIEALSKAAPHSFLVVEGSRITGPSRLRLGR